MGWHTRHASTPSGLEGHSRPETLNLTAWNHALGLLFLNHVLDISLFLFSHLDIFSLPLLLFPLAEKAQRNVRVSE